MKPEATPQHSVHWTGSPDCSPDPASHFSLACRIHTKQDSLTKQSHMQATPLVSPVQYKVGRHVQANLLRQLEQFLTLHKQLGNQTWKPQIHAMRGTGRKPLR